MKPVHFSCVWKKKKSAVISDFYITDISIGVDPIYRSGTRRNMFPKMQSHKNQLMTNDSLAVLLALKCIHSCKHEVLSYKVVKLWKMSLSGEDTVSALFCHFSSVLVLHHDHSLLPGMGRMHILYLFSLKTAACSWKQSREQSLNQNRAKPKGAKILPTAEPDDMCALHTYNILMPSFL